MKARDIVGKRVARVVQSYCQKEAGGHGGHTALERLVFEDGTVLAIVVNEHESDCDVSGLVVKPKKERTT